MKNTTTAFALLALCILTASCKKTINVPVAEDFDGTAPKRNASVRTPVLQPNFDSLRATLPSSAKERFKKASNLLLKQNPTLARIVASAVNSIPCSLTPLNTWLNNQLSDWNSDAYYYATLTGMFNLPTYDALYFGNGGNNNSYGINGEYSHTYSKTFKDLKRFWNIESDDMITTPIHGSMLQSRDKIIRTNKIVLKEDEATAKYWADLIAWLLQNVPQYRNGEHPIFSFNSYAQASFEFYPYGMIPPKIALGDGLISSYAELGFGDVAPQAILAHEYAHHVQFQNGVYNSSASASFTRRAELMADGLAAYYLSHAQGASMQWKRVKQFLQVFFNIGDCYFDNSMHHGTPVQRMAAAEWGYSLASDAQKQGHVLTGQQVIALFEEKFQKTVVQ